MKIKTKVMDYDKVMSLPRPSHKKTHTSQLSFTNGDPHCQLTDGVENQVHL